MDQDRRGAAARPPEPAPEIPDSLAAIVPKRRLWPVLAVFGMVIAIAAALVVRELTASDPLRILVAIDLDGYWWEGSEPAAKLADALAAQLRELGFEPVKGGDPKTMKVLEQSKDPEAAAKKLKAGFVIQAKLSPEVVDLPVQGGFFEVRVDAPIKLTFLDGGTSSESRIRGYAGAKDKKVAMDLLATSMATQALDAVIAQILDHPSVVALTSGSDVKLLERLNPARVFGKERAKRLAEAATAYSATGTDRQAADKGVTFHSGRMAEDRLVGVGPGGYFVKTADVAPFFSLKHRAVERMEELETVVFRSFDQKPDAPDASPMWRGYHVFTYPSSEPSGKVALVEDLFGWAKTITMTDRAGAAKRVRIDPEHRFVDPKLAPGGRFVAVNDRPHPGAPANLLVLDTASGKEIYAYHPDQQSLGGFTWIDATRIAFTVVEDAGGGNVVVVDAGKDPITIERPFKIERGKELFMPSASADGKLIVWAMSNGSSGLVVMSTDSWIAQSFPVPQSPAWPTFSPDAAHVVFEVNGEGGTDLGVLTLASGKAKKLVEGRNEERLPMFSADGKRVVFEVRYPDPMFPRVRHVSRIASIPFGSVPFGQ